MNGFNKNLLKWSLTFILVISSTYLAVKDIDFGELVIVLKGANYLWAIVPIPIIILSHFIRALRWKTILKPIQDPGPTINLFSAVMVGYFFNSIFPRLGELVRPYVYAKRQKTSVSSAFATIIVERVIDVFTLGFLFVIAFIISRHKIVTMLPGIDSERIIYFSIFILVILVFGFYPPFVNVVLRIFVKPLSDKLYERLSDMFIKFRKGFTIIKTPGSYIRLTVESLLIWVCYALPMYIMFYCFDFHTYIDVELADALFLVIVSGIGVTIAPTPSGIGVMHFLIMYAMMGLYGLREETALAYATINHAVGLMVQITVGGAFLFRERSANLSLKPTINNEDLETQP